jgi:hypothetical protein
MANTDVQDSIQLGIAIYKAQIQYHATDVDLFHCVLGMLIGRGFGPAELTTYVNQSFALVGQVPS